MVKKILLISLFIVGCTFKTPIEFSEKVLNDSFITLNSEVIQLKEILNQHKEKKILINVWASWCKDCIIALPKLKELQKEYPNVVYVFISKDRSISKWKRAINKYQLKGNHYYMSKGMDSDFGDFLNSNWIPRYLVVNENGFLDLFKAKKITDPRIVNALKK